MNPANDITPYLYRAGIMSGASWLCFGVTTEQSHKHVVFPFHFRDVERNYDINLEEFESHVRH